MAGLFNDPEISPGSEEVDDYDIKREIGRGGDGTVYLGFDSKVGREVAIKLINSDRRVDETTERRFQAESEAIASLDHPHIIPIYANGKMDGRPFYTMKYVAGGSLATRLDEFATPDTAAALMIKVARAVHHAHERGILHRDLKPSNILLDDQLEPFISDFGLAKRYEENNDLTVTGAVMGTPSFMSPEQARGDNAQITITSDVFSLGSILYQILTGKLPFEGTTSHHVLRSVIETQITFSRENRQNLGKDLVTICLKCLEKDPKKRYSSALALAEDLERWRDGKPIEARPVQAGERLRKWIRRRPVAAALVAVSSLSLLIMGIGGTMFTLQLREANREILVKAAEEHEALVQLTEDNGLRHFEDGDYFSALPWFVSALKLDAGNEERELIHRRRIGAALRSSPKLIHLWRHKVEASEALFSPDGKRILIVAKGGNKQLRLLETASGLDAHEPLEHRTPIKQAVFNHDGSRIACACEDGQIWIWDTATGRPVVPALIDRSSAVFIGFNNDGGQLITTSLEGILKVRDTTTGDEIMTRSQGFQIESAALDPNGGRIAIGASLGRFRVVDLKSGVVSFETTTNLKSPVRVLRYNGDGSRLIALTGHSAEVFDSEDGRLISPILKHPRDFWIYDGVFDPTGTRLATCGRDGMARIREFESGSSPFSPLQHKSGVRRVAYSPLGDRILTCGDDRTAIFWSARTGERIGPPLRHRRGIIHMDFSHDGSMVLTTDSGETRLWSLAGGMQAGPVITQSRAFRLKVSGDGQHVVVADGSNEVERYHVASGLAVGDVSKIDPFALPAAPCDSHTVRTLSNPSGGSKAVIDGNIAALHELETGAKQGKAMEHNELIWIAKFSGDGSLLATGSSDNSARVWDAKSGKPITPPLLSETAVMNVDLSNSGDRLATSSKSEWISVWDLSPARNSIDDLEKLSELLSGFEVHPRLGLIEKEDLPHKAILDGSRLPDLAVCKRWIWNSILHHSIDQGSQTGSQIVNAVPGGGDLDLLRKRLQLKLGPSNLAPEVVEELAKNGTLDGELGRKLKSSRKWEQAEFHLRKAVAADPNRAAYWKNLADAQAGLKQLELSLESRDRAISVNPNSASLFENRGQTYLKMEKWDEAIADFRIAAGIHSKMLFSSVGEKSPIPPREGTVPASCIDLSNYYNNSLDYYPLIDEIPGKELTDIPRGLVEFGGIPFDVRGAIRLTGSKTAPYMLPLPMGVPGIQIGRRCQRLHFLHTVHHEFAEGRDYGAIVVVFDNGRNEAIRLRYGHHARDCYFSLPKPLEDPASAAVWDAGQSFERGNPTLYRSTWENPNPDSEIVMIHYLSLNSAPNPILFAITAE